MMRGALPLWPLTVSVRRIRGAWRLLLVVTAIAVAACTLVTSVGLLVFATEQGGVRSAFSSLPADQTAIDVQLLRPSVSVEEGISLSDKAVATALGPAADSRRSSIALSEFLTVPSLSHPIPALTYFGDMQAVEAQATLLSGTWAGTARPGEPTEVAIPEKAAASLGLVPGSTIATSVGDAEVAALVTGIYRPRHPDGAYWDRDLLDGAGYVEGFPKPDVSVYIPTNAFGPLLAAPGALDAAQVPLRSLDVEYTPDFSGITVSELAPLLDRLNAAEEDVPLHIGLSGRTVSYFSDAQDGASEIASALVVTRSTVAVVGLLLLVLALAALGQTARLLNDARADERRPMRARGGSDRQLLVLATMEAILVGLVTAVASPPLARLVYRALAAQPPMTAAGMPPDAGLPPLAWAIAAGVSVLFVVILVAPLVRRAGPFIDDDQGRHRQHRASGLMRSGLDLALVAVAGVVYWQLQSYRSPVNYSASLAIDPVLVAGPAIMLLAGALLVVRLIPAASRLIARLELRSRGATFALAVWEVARRSRRITAAVLLLTLALAVGTFSQTFLSTWRHSQVDQAAFTVGAPVRVPADAKLGGTEAALLSAGATGKPQPVIRRLGSAAGPGAASAAGEGNPAVGGDAMLLGLTADARGMLDRGRLSDEGGAVINDALTSPTRDAASVPLPGDARGLAATVKIGDATQTIPGVSARMYALIQDANGLVSSTELGVVPADGREHSVQGMFPSLVTGARFAAPLNLVGVHADFMATDAEEKQPDGSGSAGFVSVMIKDTAAIQAAADEGDSNRDPGASVVTEPLNFDGAGPWSSRSSVPFGSPPSTADVPDGWQLRLAVDVPATVTTRPAQFVLMGWTPEVSLPAVISTGLADRLNVSEGALLTFLLPDAQVPVTVAGVADLIPGSRSGTQLAASGGHEGGAQGDVVVVDHAALARLLAQGGDPGSMVDEWWVDVPAGHGQAYLDAHPDRSGVAPSQSSEVLAKNLQQDPMRVSAQAALWLAVIGAALLAAIGFAMHTAAGMRSRRTEFAQLRAIGLSRRMLVGLLGAESLLLGVLGTVFGVALGVLIGWLVGPLIAVSPDGSPTIPSVLVTVPWIEVAGLVAVVVAVLAIVVTSVAGAQRSADPAGILRGADE